MQIDQSAMANPASNWLLGSIFKSYYIKIQIFHAEVNSAKQRVLIREFVIVPSEIYSARVQILHELCRVKFTGLVPQCICVHLFDIPSSKATLI